MVNFIDFFRIMRQNIAIFYWLFVWSLMTLKHFEDEIFNAWKRNLVVIQSNPWSSLTKGIKNQRFFFYLFLLLKEMRKGINLTS